MSYEPAYDDWPTQRIADELRFYAGIPDVARAPTRLLQEAAARLDATARAEAAHGGRCRCGHAGDVHRFGSCRLCACVRYRTA